jgi:lipoprotein-releasing system permease protein
MALPLRFEFFVAARYLRGKRKNRFVSLITIISVAGVSVSVIALLVVMSVMTGFDNALRDTIIGNLSHLTIVNPNRMPIENHTEVIAQLTALCPEIVGAGPFTEIKALLNHRGTAEPALIMGVDPVLESNVTSLQENLTEANGRRFGRGELPGEKEMVLGYRLAGGLGAYVGSEISVMTDKAKIRPFMGVGRGSQLWMSVSGISDGQRSDFDSLYAFVDLTTAEMLSGRKGVDGIHVKLTDPYLADTVASRIQEVLPYRTITWYESQASFFGALQQEKLAMFIILVFIILVAAFNITSTLIMIVMEKRRDIGILRTLGTSGPSILLLFILEGLMIGLGGTFIGVLLGTLLAYNINPVAEFIAGIFNVPLFDSTIYYFDRIPVSVVPMDIFWITLSAVVLTFLSTLYPAWSASRLNPVDALRYE